MEVRIAFKSEVYLKGENIKEIADKWMTLGLFSADAIENAYAETTEIESVERVDVDSYTDLSTDFFDAL